ncbi:MSMEG_1061 family FMN-dependent PPOX-type flavoprotein [Blastococcus sp. TF02A_35]|uniref:MSMEG_1061 family FMN-dependent PPOX-type flavoprotein n=1 Tax=Blastococcus sp. TF02A-35 TaxID=2559612 RepID=UPI001073B67A|nr:MSMEG_1061 family FMN-dependent PPOX-type flavoprotein [Blastococcus sp. TF02A_35]TFV51523.1 pyridoxamine 5'-phosphate oxidase family protein [Blastococcus sp. TF02A_35]
MSAPEPLPGYRPPNQAALDKEVDRLDRHCQAFIRQSPWLTLATSDAGGFPDVSPRGGEPGFVKVLDEHRLVLPDRPGNDRVDSLRNVTANPRVALMFVVPGVQETLRVYGAASVVPPDEVGPDLTEFGRPPRSALVVQVRRAYFQCARSLLRSGLWDPERWPGRGDLAPMGEVFRDHCRLPAPLPADDVLHADLVQNL